MRMSISLYWVNAECISANSESTPRWEILWLLTNNLLDLWSRLSWCQKLIFLKTISRCLSLMFVSMYNTSKTRIKTGKYCWKFLNFLFFKTLSISYFFQLILLFLRVDFLATARLFSCQRYYKCSHFLLVLLFLSLIFSDPKLTWSPNLRTYSREIYQTEDRILDQGKRQDFPLHSVIVSVTLLTLSAEKRDFIKDTVDSPETK